MSTSAAFKPILGVFAALSLLSLGACETGKGLSLSAAGLTAANTANRAAFSGAGGQTVNPNWHQPSAATPSSTTASPSDASARTTQTAVSTTPATQAVGPATAAINEAAPTLGGESELPVQGILDMAGNANLLAANETGATEGTTPISSLLAAVTSAVAPAAQPVQMAAVNGAPSSLAASTPPTSSAFAQGQSVAPPSVLASTVTALTEVVAQASGTFAPAGVPAGMTTPGSIPAAAPVVIAAATNVVSTTVQGVLASSSLLLGAQSSSLTTGSALTLAKNVSVKRFGGL